VYRSQVTQEMQEAVRQNEEKALAEYSSFFGYLAENLVGTFSVFPFINLIMLFLIPLVGYSTMAQQHTGQSPLLHAIFL
jgi:hypothetical protein